VTFERGSAWIPPRVVKRGQKDRGTNFRKSVEETLRRFVAAAPPEALSSGQFVRFNQIKNNFAKRAAARTSSV